MVAVLNKTPVTFCFGAVVLIRVLISSLRGDSNSVGTSVSRLCA